MGSENALAIIDDEINLLDNSAIQILRTIESQKILVVKSQNLWDELINEGVSKTVEILPGIQEIPEQIKTATSKLNELEDLLLILVQDCLKNEKSIALQYRAKLAELLNKY